MRKTMRIDKATGITEVITWCSEDMRSFCICHGFYTLGDCRAYEELLEFVESHIPSIRNQLYAARNIKMHSDTNWSELYIISLFNKDNIVARLYIREGEQ